MAARDGLAVQVAPPSPGPVDLRRPATDVAGGPFALYGVVPDGVTSVAVSTSTGAKTTTTVSDNVFALVTDRPVLDLELRR